jgi:hypothetical protein
LVSTWPRYTFTLYQALLGIGSILLSGIKIYPFFTVFGSSPRIVTDTAGMNLQHLLLAITDSKPYAETGSISYHGWWEHGIGIGIIIPVLALFFLPKLKNWRGILVVLILTVWFGMGNSPSYINPWYLANTYLPVFENFRAPFRFFIGPALAFILIIPLGLKTAPHYTKHVLLALSISLLYATSNVLSISKSSTTSINSSAVVNEYLEMNINTKIVDIHPDLEYYQYLMLAEDKHLVNTKYPLLDDIQQDGTYWINGASVTTNNQQSISLTATKDLVLTNINYSPFWQISGGTIQNRKGKISIDTSKEAEIRLDYKPTYWTTGWMISFVGFLFIILTGYWAIKKLQPSEDVL